MMMMMMMMTMTTTTSTRLQSYVKKKTKNNNHNNNKHYYYYYYNNKKKKVNIEIHNTVVGLFAVFSISSPRCDVSPSQMLTWPQRQGAARHPVKGGRGGGGGGVSLDRPLGGDQELGRVEEREEHRDDVTPGKTWRR